MASAKRDPKSLPVSPSAESEPESVRAGSGLRVVASNSNAVLHGFLLALTILLPFTRAQEPLRLTLDDAVALGLRNNQALKIALLDATAERERVLEAMAAFDPVIFAELSLGRREFLNASNFPLNPSDPNSPTVTRILSQTQDRGDFRTGLRGVLETGLTYDLTFQNDYAKRETDSGLNPIWTSSTALNLRQPLLRSAFSEYMTANVELARLNGLSADQTYRLEGRRKLAEIHQAYFDLVLANAEVDVQQRSVLLAREQLSLTILRIESGSLPDIEKTSAESALAGRVADLLSAESRSVEAEDRLRRLILSFENAQDWQVRMQPVGENLEVRGRLLDLDELIRLAEFEDPDVLRAHVGLARSRIVKMQRESEREPQLDLTGSLTWTGLSDKLMKAQRLSYDGNEGATSWTVGLSFEVPIGNRAAEARVAVQMLELKRAALTLQDARTTMIFNVRNAERKVMVARKSLEARREAARLAREQLANERLRLDLRRSTNFQVFQVESELNERERDLLRTLVEHRLAILELSRTVGVPEAAVWAVDSDRTVEPTVPEDSDPGR
ncbi:MAG TPA: TolC family protein [Planctomycetota bacterium]|nr:TolC family protein [Planctomycetota bacterium]